MPVDERLKSIAAQQEQAGRSPSEILDMIGTSESYKDVGGTIANLRQSGRDDNEIYSLLKTAKGVSPPAPGREPSGLVKGILAFPGSMYRDVGKPLYEAAKQPVKTLRGIADVVTGAAEKVIPESVLSALTATSRSPGPTQGEQAIEAVGENIKGDYGSIEALGKTLTEKPAIPLMDLSSLLMGGGTAMAGRAGKIGTIGRAMSATGKAIDPLSMVKIAARAPRKLIPEKGVEKMYGSSLKMSTTLEPGERASRIKTGLSESIMPNEKGLVKLQSKISDLNKAIDDKIVSAAEKGATVSTADIATRLDDLKQFYSNTIGSQEFLDDIAKIEEMFKAQEGTTIPIARAQQIKKNTYTLLRKHYGEMKAVGIESRKQLARGIREEISKQYPEIDALNKADKALIELEESVARAAARIANRDIIGLGMTAKTGAGGVVDVITGTKGAGALAGITLGLLDTPSIKAKLAIVLNKARKAKTVTKHAPKRAVAFQATRAAEPKESVDDKLRSMLGLGPRR